LGLIFGFIEGAWGVAGPGLEEGFGVKVRGFVGVEAVPDLGNKRITFGDLVVVPRGREALRAPMATQEDESRRRHEAMAKLALPLERRAEIALNHRFAQAFAATEGSSLAHIVDSPFRARFGLVVAMIKMDRRLGRM